MQENQKLAYHRKDVKKPDARCHISAQTLPTEKPRFQQIRKNHHYR